MFEFEHGLCVLVFPLRLDVDFTTSCITFNSINSRKCTNMNITVVLAAPRRLRACGTLLFE